MPTGLFKRLLAIGAAGAALLVVTPTTAYADFSNGHSHFSELHRHSIGWKYSYFDDNFGYQNSTYIFTDSSVQYQTATNTIKLSQTRIKFATNGGRYMAVRNWRWVRSDGAVVASGFGFTRSHGGNASWNCVESDGWCGEVSANLNRSWTAFTFFADVVDATADKYEDTVTVRIYPTG